MKKRVKWIKSVSWCLILVMLAAALAACTTAEFEQLKKLEEQLRASASLGETTGAPSVETEISSETPTYIVCPGPGGEHKDSYFDNYEFVILAWEEGKASYWSDKDNDMVVEEALYRKNEIVAERLGVKLVWDFKPGGGNKYIPFANNAQSLSLSGNPYDAILCYGMNAYYLAAYGNLANLADTNYINLTARWWSEALIDQTMINGRIYSLVEDNDIGLLRNMTAVFFNNDVLEKQGFESPYELVKQDVWTVDKLSEMIKDTYVDLNANGSADAEDLFGFANASNTQADAWFYALGYKEAEVRGGEVISLLGEQGIFDYVEKMTSFYHDTKDAFWSDSERNKMFLENRVYFYTATVQSSEKFCFDTNGELNYGVVPMPKLNTEQSQYYTYVGNSYNAWCIPGTAPDMDCSSAVLECMAFESYRVVGPVYFDTNLKLRYAPDERLAEMYDIIRAGIVFDVGRAYTQLRGGFAPQDTIRKIVKNPSKNAWYVAHLNYKDVWQESFDLIITTYTK